MEFFLMDEPFFFKLKDNCFTVFCGFLSYINKSQPLVHPCSLPPEPPSHLPPHPTLQPASHRATVWVPWVIHQIPIGCLFYTWYYKFPCYSLHISPFLPPLLPPPHVHKSVLYVWVSTVKMKWKWKSLSSVELFGTSWTVQSKVFSRPEYWSG